MATDESVGDEGDPFGLSETERDQFAKDGFFVREDAFDKDEIDTLSGRIDELVWQVESSSVLAEEKKRVILKRNVKAEKRSGPESLNSVFRAHLFSRLVRDHIRAPRRLGPVSQLLGPDLFCPNDLYFFKAPGTGRPIAWHQDSWYFNNTYESSEGSALEDTSIGTWLAIDDANVKNGCLWGIAGSHLAGVVEHSEIGHGEDLPVRHSADVARSLKENEIPVEVSKGSLVFFNNALLHRSTPNHSDTFRRAYVVHYMMATIRHKAAWFFRGGPKRMGDWGTVEAYIHGRQIDGCVKTTSEEASLDWDAAVGRDLKAEEVRVSAT